MRRLAILLGLILVLLPVRALAHVGSPDVFFEGDAGPYRLFVTVRTPQVIPGIAEIEVRSEGGDVSEVTVVPMRLTGPGSRLPPTPDHAARSAVDPRFFTASLWLMERGSLQVRITANGAHGVGQLGVPVPAVARTTLTMTKGLGGLLLGLMLVLAVAIVSIASGAVREVTLEPGVTPPPRARRRAILATMVFGAAVVGVLGFGNAWWNAEAADYARMVQQPWRVRARLDGCHLVLPKVPAALLPDHGHEMHLFLIRVPDLDRMVHVHPERLPGGGFGQELPWLTAGHYRLFADVVLASGFPITGTGELDVPDLQCPPPSGDDSVWWGDPQGTTAALPHGARMIWNRPPVVHAGVALPLTFRVENADGTPAALETYMGMAGHVEVVRADGSVFAHLHPSGSVAMPALELARESLGGAPMEHMNHAMPVSQADLAFPYGFPRTGAYRIFVQVKQHGQVVTGAFDVQVEE